MIMAPLLFYLFVFSAGAAPCQVDRIIAVIYDPLGAVEILSSDVRPGLDGRSRTLDDVLNEQLVVLEAQRHHMSASDDDVDRYLEQMQRKNQINRAQVEQIFKAQGYTYEEGHAFLKRKLMYDEMIDYKIRTDKRMLISQQEVEDYYMAHPQKEPAQVTLSVSFIPATDLSDLQRTALISEQRVPASAVWDDPVTYAIDELADERQDMVRRSPGDIVLVEAVEGGFEATRLDALIPEKLVPLEQCYGELVAEIRQSRFDEVRDEYVAELRRRASIRFVTQ